MNLKCLTPAVILILAAVPGIAAEPPGSGASWIDRSNENAQVLLDVLARFAPEGAARLGVTGLDEEIFDLTPGSEERATAAAKAARAELERRLRSETDPLVRQDLEILIRAVTENIDSDSLDRRTFLPYFDVGQSIFLGIRSLLDEQVAADRRPASLVRLRKYTGTAPGTTPLARLAMDRIRERLTDRTLLGPVKEDVEKDLANIPSMLDGIEELFKSFSIAGYEGPYAELRRQIAEYEAFVRKEVLPAARTDFRQPPAVYAFQVERSVGVDMSVPELVSRARTAFREIQNEMQALAPLVAKEKGIAATDYRDVIRELKKNQLVGDAILPHYEARIRDMEEIIRREKIITLPDRPMQIRLASAAESAVTPAPNMRPPRFLGNTGELGTFVLPLRVPAAPGEPPAGFDDFTFESASWTLTAHEGRPGHELQFASVVEKGVSTARAFFALNSVNVEGWALYAEAEVKPYLPLDGQMISLQHRLLRAARAFLDPGLQSGDVTREEAARILKDDVVLSTAMVNQEVERYTFRAPGQATSYFCGYQRFMELRATVENRLGAGFDRQRYHDFILAQGLLPISMIRRAVLDEFVPAEKKAG